MEDVLLKPWIVCIHTTTLPSHPKPTSTPTIEQWNLNLNLLQICKPEFGDILAYIKGLIIMCPIMYILHCQNLLTYKNLKQQDREKKKNKRTKDFRAT